MVVIVLSLLSTVGSVYYLCNLLSWVLISAALWVRPDPKHRKLFCRTVILSGKQSAACQSDWQNEVSCSSDVARILIRGEVQAVPLDLLTFMYQLFRICLTLHPSLLVVSITRVHSRTAGKSHVLGFDHGHVIAGNPMSHLGDPGSLDFGSCFVKQLPLPVTSQQRWRVMARPNSSPQLSFQDPCEYLVLSGVRQSLDPMLENCT